MATVTVTKITVGSFVDTDLRIWEHYGDGWRNGTDVARFPDPQAAADLRAIADDLQKRRHYMTRHIEDELVTRIRAIAARLDGQE